jgi:hypothetical protein
MMVYYFLLFGNEGWFSLEVQDGCIFYLSGSSAGAFEQPEAG